MTPFDPEAVLTRPLMANLASVAEDGAPRNSPVWYIWEDAALWMLGSTRSGAVRRLTRDPRAAVEITHFDSAAGILLHLGLRGEAEIEVSDAGRFLRLLDRYLGPRDGWNPWFIREIARIDDPQGRMIRLAPEEIFTNNVSYFRTGPALAWPA